MLHDNTRDLKYDFVLPTLLFASLGGMSWAVRGSPGYGGGDGCIFAGTLWGLAWWYIAREPVPIQSRRYTSGWIVLAMAVGFYIAGGRGWAQWWTLYDHRLQLDYAKGLFHPISPVYGYAWVFISGIPWAGLGACMLAWCGDAARPSNGREWGLWCVKWALRIGFGVAGGMLANAIFVHNPKMFLPLYELLKDNYNDRTNNPNLYRITNDNRAAITHLGLYLGFLLFEVARRDWKNVTLITTVGLLNGVMWSIVQNWALLNVSHPNAFNWWRCWESSGGITIGIALGVAYYLVNGPLSREDQTKLGDELTDRWPNAERAAAYLGLILGVGFSTRNGLEGFTRLLLEEENFDAKHWAKIYWQLSGLLMIIALGVLIARAVMRRVRARSFTDGTRLGEDVFPHAYAIVWATLIVMNILAQMATRSWLIWIDQVYAVYYLVLFGISAAIFHHYYRPKEG